MNHGTNDPRKLITPPRNFERVERGRPCLVPPPPRGRAPAPCAIEAVGPGKSPYLPGEIATWPAELPAPKAGEGRWMVGNLTLDEYLAEHFKQGAAPKAPLPVASPTPLRPASVVHATGGRYPIVRDICRRGQALVFAYGSNLDEGQMRHRCPGCKVLCSAVLYGHKIEFVSYSSIWGGAVANVRPARGNRVPGLIYLVGDADLRYLDSYEGAPSVYGRITRHVCSAYGSFVPVQVYVHTRPNRIYAPSKKYLKRISHGYRREGFDLTPLIQAVKEAPVERPKFYEAPRYVTLPTRREMPPTWSWEEPDEDRQVSFFQEGWV